MIDLVEEMAMIQDEEVKFVPVKDKQNNALTRSVADQLYLKTNDSK